MGNYVFEYKLLLKQSDVLEEKIIEIHKRKLKGHSASQAENNFLRLACQLDTYGIDPHPVKVYILIFYPVLILKLFSILGSQRQSTLFRNKL